MPGTSADQHGMIRSPIFDAGTSDGVSRPLSWSTDLLGEAVALNGRMIRLPAGVHAKVSLPPTKSLAPEALRRSKKPGRCAPTATPMPEFCRRDHVGFTSGPRTWV